MPRSGIARSYGSSIFKFLGTFILFSIVAASIYIPTNSAQEFLFLHILASERLLLNGKTPRFYASGGDEFNLGPETSLDHSELFCSKVLLNYKGDRGSF